MTVISFEDKLRDGVENSLGIRASEEDIVSYTVGLTTRDCVHDEDEEEETVHDVLAIDLYVELTNPDLAHPLFVHVIAYNCSQSMTQIIDGLDGLVDKVWTDLTFVQQMDSIDFDPEFHPGE